MRLSCFYHLERFCFLFRDLVLEEGARFFVAFDFAFFFGGGLGRSKTSVCSSDLEATKE